MLASLMEKTGVRELFDKTQGQISVSGLVSELCRTLKIREGNLSYMW